MNTPVKLYGLRVSYYSGKMEAYLRYKEIPFEFVTLNRERMLMLRDRTGAGQMPAVELADGRIMTDTTPMIQWFEQRHPNPPVIPLDPVQRAVSLLLEDYAEEWLWRPAMHYRWSYRGDRLLLSRKIVDEFMPDIPAPGFAKRAFIRRRQWGEYVRRDGVNATTWDHVESIYLNTLDRLEQIFTVRPYLLGRHPTIADFGFFASMFRHFGEDPTASAIMRRRAPRVFEWQARVWNARTSDIDGAPVNDLPDDLDPLLQDAGDAYLPYLNDNARAWQQGLKRFNHSVQGVQYSNVPVSQYRVWCLEQLQRHARAVPDDLQPQLRERLQKTGCWDALFEIDNPGSGYDEAAEVPFRGRKVHYDNRVS
ncbi:MAG: glutathione S-transferase [Gammaproteobacteria bacterium AqS3]|nr:glutathione S-transferase [Gammaproteobacteria bacterium AqS3]